MYFQTIENDAKTLPCAHSLKFNYPRIFQEHNHGHYFFVYGHKYDRRDVMWKPRIVPIYIQFILIIYSHNTNETTSIIVVFKQFKT